MIPPTHYWRWDDMPHWRDRAATLHAFALAGADAVVLSDRILSESLGSLAAAAHWRRALADAGLRFRDAHATFIGGCDDPMSPDPALRRAALARLRAELDLCAAFGVDTVTVHAGNQVAETERGPAGVRAAEERLWRALEAILPAAESAGVCICLENIFFPTATPEVLLEAVRRFPSPSLGLCFDSGHANVVASRFASMPDQLWTREAAKTGCEPVRDDAVLEKMLPHVVNCHLHDNDGFTDRHWLPGSPGGTVDWGAVVARLRAAPRLRCAQNEALVREERPFAPAESVASLRALGL